MNTTTMLYVGIDVSKDKSDICIKDVKGNDLIQRFFTVIFSPEKRWK